MSKSEQNSNDKKQLVISEIKSFFCILLFALMIRTLIFEPFIVPTESMRETIIEGDYIFATKYSYGYSRYSVIFSPPLFDGRILASDPEYGDIVIMRPPHLMNIRYIKRVVGLPGDTIQMKNGHLHINGKPIERALIEKFIYNGEGYTSYREKLPNGVEYTAQYKDNANKYILRGDGNIQAVSSSLFEYYDKSSATASDGLQDKKIFDGNNTDVFTVPEGHYFMMGDNRDNSLDSRFSLGYVPFENFIAKAQFAMLSFEQKLPESILNVSEVFNFITSIRTKRMFHNLYHD